MTAIAPVVTILNRPLPLAPDGAPACSGPAGPAWTPLHTAGRAAEADPSVAWVVIMAHGACGGKADQAWLTDAEHQRAAGYRTPQRQRAFTIGRRLVRQLLFDDEPGRLTELSLNAHGKPFVCGRPDFCLSHTAGCTGLSVDAASPIGLDIESTSGTQASRNWIDHFAHPREAEALRAATDAEFPALFLRCWTRKEALLKAMGRGFSHPPATLDVQLTEPSPTVEAGCAWRLVDLPLPAGCGAVAALATRPAVERVLVVLIEDALDGPR